MEFYGLYIQIRRSDGSPLSPDDIETVTEYCAGLQKVLDTTNVYGDPFDFLVEAFPQERMILVELSAYPLEGLTADGREQFREQIEHDDVPQAETVRTRLEDHMGMGYEVNVLLGEE